MPELDKYNNEYIHRLVEEVMRLREENEHLKGEIFKVNKELEIADSKLFPKKSKIDEGDQWASYRQ